MSCKNRSINAFKRHLPLTQKKPCVLKHTMATTSTTDSSEVPAPPVQIVAKTHASGLAAAAAANSADEADAIIIGAGYAVTTPPRDVGVTANAGLLEKPGTGSSPDTGELPIEVPMVSGTGGVSVTAGTQAGVTAPTVHLQWV